MNLCTVLHHVALWLRTRASTRTHSGKWGKNDLGSRSPNVCVSFFLDLDVLFSFYFIFHQSNVKNIPASFFFKCEDFMSSVCCLHLWRKQTIQQQQRRTNWIKNGLQNLSFIRTNMHYNKMISGVLTHGIIRKWVLANNLHVENGQQRWKSWNIYNAAHRFAV